jgi:hypothetical protein
MHGFSNSKTAVTLLLDTERAFDKVWTTRLIANLLWSPQLIQTIHNNLQNSSFSAMRRSSYSSLRPIETGEPQNSLLGPTLFHVYINEIPTAENDCNVTISVYADDTNISARSGSVDIAVRKLNAAIAFLEPWFRKWRMRINTRNAQLRCFSNDCITIAAVRSH